MEVIYAPNIEKLEMSIECCVFCFYIVYLAEYRLGFG